MPLLNNIQNDKISIARSKLNRTARYDFGETVFKRKATSGWWLGLAETDGNETIITWHKAEIIEDETDTEETPTLQ